MNSFEKNQKTTNRIELSLCLIITLLMVKNIFFVIEYTQPFQSTANNIIAIIVLLIFLRNIKTLMRRVGRAIIVVFFVSVLYVLLQIFIFPQNSSFMFSDIPRIVFFGLIPFLLAMAVKDYRTMLDYFRRGSYIIVGAAVITILPMYLNGSLDRAHYMSYGECTAIGVIIIEHFMLKDKKWIDVILFILGIISMFLVGTRGPFLGIICYFALHILFVDNHKSYRALASGISIVVIGLIAYTQLPKLLELVSGVLVGLGIRNRSLMLILNGTVVSHDSGRSYVYDIVMELIDKHPLIGIGYDGMMGLGYTNITPHNTYLEFLVYNGIFVGSILIIIISILWMNGIFRNKGTSLNILCLIFFSLYVPRSFIGAGGIQAPEFWLLLAFSISSILKSSEISRQVKNKQIET